MNLEIRKIKKEELLKDKKVSAVAFEEKYDLTIDENESYPEDEVTAYGAFDGGKMAARMTVLHHKVYFDGHAVNSAGMGGVATLPEYRRSGAVRRIFGAVFEDMKKKNQYISQLYPFSFAFYNKFGYGTAYERLNLKIPFSLLNNIERNNRCVLTEDRNDKVLREVYERYASGRNGANKRGDREWKEKISENIYDKLEYPYVYYNEKNEPAGYFLYTPDKKHDDRSFRIIELCYNSPEDIAGILGFIRNFESDYDNIKFFNIPAGEDFSLMFTNQYDVERSPAFSGMTCIADAEKIFALMKYPEGSGSFSMEIDDAFQESNKGIYQIAYKNGKAADIERRSGNADADIRMPSFVLAKLVYGTDDICSHRYKFIKGFEINGNIETLKKVFVKKQIYMGDFY